MSRQGVVIFHTTSAVMMAEKLLLQAGLTIKLIPVPREFSSDCGIAIRFDWDRGEEVKGRLEEAGVEIDSVHVMNEKK